MVWIVCLVHAAPTEDMVDPPSRGYGPSVDGAGGVSGARDVVGVHGVAWSTRNI